MFLNFTSCFGFGLIGILDKSFFLNSLKTILTHRTVTCMTKLLLNLPVTLLNVFTCFIYNYTYFEEDICTHVYEITINAILKLS